MKNEDPRLAAENLDEQMLKDETEEQKKKRHGYPSYDVEKLFEEVNAGKFIKKLREHKISNKIFWTLEEEELQKNFEIDVWGASKRIYIRRSEILADHKKAMERFDKLKDSNRMKKMTNKDKENVKLLLKG